MSGHQQPRHELNVLLTQRAMTNHEKAAAATRGETALAFVLQREADIVSESIRALRAILKAEASA